MPSARDIKRRIRSVRNISKVTKAMETVAASRMRRAQAQVLATRPYAEKAHDVLTYLARLAQVSGGGNLDPLLAIRPIHKIGLVLITADRGLAGGLNSNAVRLAHQFIRSQTAPVEVITVGKKGRDWMLRYGPPLRAEFAGLGEHPNSLSIAPISRLIIDEFTSGYFDAVHVIYTDFINTLVQKPVHIQILPVEPAAPTAAMASDYIFEPDIQTVLSQVLRNFIEIQLLQGLYENIASEQAARMVAMRNATEAALELIGDLTLSYNKKRQEGITRELLDIVGGANALAQT